MSTTTPPETTTPIKKFTGTKKPAAPKKGNVVAPSELIPDPGEVKTDELHTYWAGALPNCPEGGVFIAGMDFVKQCQPLIRCPQQRHMKTWGSERAGRIVTVTRKTLDRLCELLPKSMYRFMGPDKSDELFPDRGRPAIRVTIYTEEELEEARDRPHLKPTYVPRVEDEPVGDYLYLVYAPNGHRLPDDQLPECINKTGIEYPPEDAVPAAGPAPTCS